MTTKLGTLRVGTAGWTNDAWRGPFYPPGTTTSEKKLDAYQQHFCTVENNGTCHSTPSTETVTRWKNKCGKGFEMAVKMSKYVTHETKRDCNEESLRTFANHISGLKDNLGPILFQFPRTRKVSVALIRNMAHILQQCGSDLRDVKIAVEIRHADSVQNDQVLQELRKLRWCLVAHPNSIGRGTVIAEHGHGFSESHGLEPLDNTSWPITAGDWIYVRLHGTNDEHRGRYSDSDLKMQAVPAICHWLRNGINVYAYILCDDDRAGMPLNAKSLERLCHAELGTDIPKAPKEVKSIASFFGKKTCNEKKRASETNEDVSSKRRKA